MRLPGFLALVLAGLVPVLPGCQQALVQRTDSQVYSLLRERQRDALGMTTDVHLGSETGEVSSPDRMYSFNPRPTDSAIPEEFLTPRDEPIPGTDTEADAAEAAGLGPGQADDGESSELVQDLVGADLPEESPADRPVDPGGLAETDVELISPSIFPPEVEDQVIQFGLDDALAYADRHARELQAAKEDLYLAALALTLERHLWTPQFVGTVQAEYTNAGQAGEFDEAMTAVSEFAVSQRLPFGGEVTARVVNSLMRDLSTHATSGEPGSVILEANLPLLRGAGRAAYESRYTAERELIYAVRSYERFRRAFLVRTADEYFDLQQRRSAIYNTYVAYESRFQDWRKADFVNRMGQSRSIFEAPRAKASFRQAEAGLVNAMEQYATALDQFKIFLGMPVETLLDVLDQDADDAARALESLLPSVDADTVESVALKYRLDLLNSADRVDDARRGVLIAKNAILPDLNVSGSGVMDSDQARLNSASFNTERTTWRADIVLSMDDRKTERNRYRASIIDTRRAEREYQEFTDGVRAEVRRALRRIEQQEKLIEIQALNVEENEFRLAAARAQFDLGLSTNQDVVDAENDLLNARNDYAGAVSGYRSAILAFRLATGTLRVTDDGQWALPEASWRPPPRPPDTNPGP